VANVIDEIEELNGEADECGENSENDLKGLNCDFGFRECFYRTRRQVN
jgi:hypothetical protein